MRYLATLILAAALWLSTTPAQAQSWYWDSPPANPGTWTQQLDTTGGVYWQYTDPRRPLWQESYRTTSPPLRIDGYMRAPTFTERLVQDLLR